MEQGTQEGLAGQARSGTYHLHSCTLPGTQSHGRTSLRRILGNVVHGVLTNQEVDFRTAVGLLNNKKGHTP